MAVLYVTATPIGNLQDLSPRAVETLRAADWILAEDTRVTMKLCQVFDLHARLISCHRHNEENIAASLAEKMLEENLTAALVTDAGTPCISDPGNEVVAACIEREIPVLPIPGCCAAVSAISISGFDAREFAFYGFLPRNGRELRAKLKDLPKGPAVAALHESPFRIIELTEAVADVLPQARMAVCCDLTKLHEKTIYGSPRETLEKLKSNPKTEKGEYCVILDLHACRAEEQEAPETGCARSLEARLTDLMKEGCSLREAQEKLVTSGEKKNAVKQAALQLKKWFSPVEEN